jgi:hypothetical protein
VIEAHMRKHAGELLGEFARRLGVVFLQDGLSTQARWRRGFVSDLGLIRSSMEEPLSVVLAAALEHPSCALLRGVKLHNEYEHDPDTAAAIAVLARAPRTLHSVALDLPNPTSLECLYAHPIDALGLGFGFARSLVDTASVTLASVARAPWQLRGLTLHLGGALPPDPLVELLARDLPLEELQIWGDDVKDPAFAAAVTRALVESPVVPRLSRLTFRLGGMKRKDNELLVTAGYRFTKLLMVTLKNSNYTSRMRAAAGTSA